MICKTVCVCVCVCVFVSQSACMSVNLCACVCMHACACVHACVCLLGGDGSWVVASTALVVVWLAVYLTGYSDLS